MSNFNSQNADFKNSLTYIDITSFSKLFFGVKLINVIVVYLTLSMVISTLTKIIVGNTNVNFYLVNVPIVAALCFSGWIAWKNITVIRSVNQPHTIKSLIVFTLCSIYYIVIGIQDIRDEFVFYSAKLIIIESMLILFFSIFVSLFAIICLIKLKNKRIHYLGLTLPQLLKITSPKIENEEINILKPKNFTKGILFFVIGFLILLIESIYDSSITTSEIKSKSSIEQIIYYFAFYLFFNSRCYFQPTYRKPILKANLKPVLLLRSFVDDEASTYSGGDSFIDNSLESRIVEHFSKIGPFVAFTNPHLKKMIFGVPRISFNDAEWKEKIIDILVSSKIIVLMTGITDSVTWELKKIVELEQAYKTIICFPNHTLKLFSKDKRFCSDTRYNLARLETVTNAFSDTKWGNAILTLHNTNGIKCLVFEGNGKVNVIVANTENRNAYHLAILIAHHLIDRNCSDTPNSGAIHSKNIQVNNIENSSNTMHQINW